MTDVTLKKAVIAVVALITLILWSDYKHHPECHYNCMTDISAKRR
jgi:hypothetical protein